MRHVPVLLTTLLLLTGIPAEAKPKSAPKIEETVLSEVPLGVVPRRGIAFSHDGTHVIYKVGRGDKTHARLNNTEGPAFDEIKRVRFLGTTNRAWYVGRRGAKWHAVIDGKISGGYDRLFWVESAEDGSRPNYKMKIGGQWYFQLDGKQHGPFDEIKTLLVHGKPGTFLASVVSKGRGQVIANGSVVATHDEIRQLGHSKDGKHTVWVARDGKQTRLVTNGKPSAAYEDIRPDFEPHFDKQGLVYAVAENEGKTFVVHGTSKTELPLDDVWTVKVLHDGRTVVGGTRGGKAYAVVTGQAPFELPGSMVSRMTVSEDGRHWAVITTDFRTRKSHVTVDGAALSAHPSISGFKGFTKDGRLRHVVTPLYMPADDKKWEAHLHGKLVLRADDIKGYHTTADGRVVIAGEEAGQGFVQVGERRYVFPQVDGRSFRVEGAHAVFGSMRDRRLIWVRLPLAP